MNPTKMLCERVTHLVDDPACYPAAQQSIRGMLLFVFVCAYAFPLYRFSFQYTGIFFPLVWSLSGNQKNDDVS